MQRCSPPPLLHRISAQPATRTYRWFLHTDNQSLRGLVSNLTARGNYGALRFFPCTLHATLAFPPCKMLLAAAGVPVPRATSPAYSSMGLGSRLLTAVFAYFTLSCPSNTTYGSVWLTWLPCTGSSFFQASFHK